MKRSQKGFTLIELVVVIVLLGIVGAVATARFQDLSTEAATAAVNAVAAEISSASAINYAAASLGTAGSTAITGAAFACTGADALLAQGALPADYVLSGTADCSTGAGTAVNTCVLTYTRGTATFTANPVLICTG